MNVTFGDCEVEGCAARAVAACDFRIGRGVVCGRRVCSRHVAGHRTFAGMHVCSRHFAVRCAMVDAAQTHADFLAPVEAEP